MQTELRAWTVKDSIELYNVSGWGRDFFSINEAGNVEVTPAGPGSLPIDLKELVDDLRSRGLNLPLLIRFSDILRTRVEQLFGAFQQAIAENDYKGAYRGVYPIKVNQQRHVVEELMEYGRPYNLGIEAGSKPELLVALALQENPEALILCNGYKDRAFIETALLAQKLGRAVVITMDRMGELDTILAAAAELDLRPVIGVRARLTTKGAGKWVESTGDRSKFGLTTAEIVATVEKLRGLGMLDCLQLLHFHIGSQITNIRAVKDALREASRIYVELHALGANMRYLDCGGGLGVDYDGSQTNFHSSVNYTLHEYAVRHRQPGGRGLQRARRAPPRPRHRVGPRARGPPLGARLQRPRHERDPRRPDPASRWRRTSTRSSSSSGRPTRASRARTSRRPTTTPSRSRRRRSPPSTWASSTSRPGRASRSCSGRPARSILKIVRDLPYVPDELEGLEKQLTDTYYCNFSLFQSMPDHWAVRQLFPTIPIHRLNKQPPRRGRPRRPHLRQRREDRRVHRPARREALPRAAHPERRARTCIATFLVGAYQEILGDLHNLFGDTDAVHVKLDGDDYRVEHVVEGDSVAEVLSYVQYYKDDLISRVRRAVEAALREKRLTIAESGRFMKRYEEALEGYTYLSLDE